MDNLNGYKAFEPGMICKGKQYQENTDYEEDNVWDEIPDAVPEERQVEARMEELMSELKGKRIALKELLQERNKKNRPLAGFLH